MVAYSGSNGTSQESNAVTNLMCRGHCGGVSVGRSQKRGINSSSSASSSSSSSITGGQSISRRSHVKAIIFKNLSHRLKL